MAQTNPRPKNDNVVARLVERVGSCVEVAAALGVHRTTVRRWERGENRIPYAVARLAALLLADIDGPPGARRP